MVRLNEEFLNSECSKSWSSARPSSEINMLAYNMMDEYGRLLEEYNLHLSDFHELWVLRGDYADNIILVQSQGSKQYTAVNPSKSLQLTKGRGSTSVSWT